MKKTAIKIEYNNKEWTSDFKERNEEEAKELQGTVKEAAEAKRPALIFPSGNQVHHFPLNILIQSVITIVVQDEE